MTPSDIDAVVGRRLRLLRLLSNLQAEDIAALLDVDLAQVSAWEAGRSRFEPVHMAALAREMRLPLGWFFFGFRDDELEHSMVTEIEDAAGGGSAGDVLFLTSLSRLFGTYGPCGSSEDPDRFLMEARQLVAQRIAGDRR